MSLVSSSLFLLCFIIVNAERCTNELPKPDLRDLRKVVCEMFPEFWWFNCQKADLRSGSNPVRDYCEKAQNDPTCCIVFADLQWCQTTSPPPSKVFAKKRFCQRYPYHSLCQFKPTPAPQEPFTSDPKTKFCNTYPNFYLPECRNYQVTTPVYDTHPISGKTCQCVYRWQCKSNDVSDLARLSQCGDFTTYCCPLEDVVSDNSNDYTSCGLKGNEWTNGNQISVARFARILDNNYADFGEYPWQAAILFDNYTYNCGGALIHPQWIATAGHCIKTLTEDNILVRLGEFNTETDSEPPYQEYGIQKIVFHPQFNKETLANDLVLLKLSQPAQLNKYINVICLTPDIDFTGKNCTVSGWGRDSPRGPFSPVLKEVDVPVVSNSFCQMQYRNTLLGPYFNLDDSFLCAGAPNKDACEGDGGSPLVCEQNGIYHLAGIVSWGISCGDYPGVYVRIPSKVSWIEQVIYNKNQY